MRKSGILMHITSLPAPHGIGTLGGDAYAFVDFLHNSRMGIWQLLPIGPVDGDNSPYASFSTFAGNSFLIDLDWFVQRKMLTQKQVNALDYGNDEARVDYPKIRQTREVLLYAAYKKGYPSLRREVEDFALQNDWLADYALFMAVHKHFGNVQWQKWPDESIRMRSADALVEYRRALSDEVAYHEFIQYVFFTQWNALKKYANEKGVSLFGDMPIYVALDSSDTWANKAVFQLEENGMPLATSGVPPDYYSEDGQSWGNPLYDWDHLETTGYAWWVERMRKLLSYFDILRIDHFIGLARYYAIPYGAASAREGEYCPGPGMKLFDALNAALGKMNLVVEDLGVVTDEVADLLEKSGLPGMNVLPFAFGSDENNPHLPQNIKKHSAVYTSTHDSDTVLGWWQGAQAAEKKYTIKVAGKNRGGDIADTIIRMALASRAEIAILQMQDVLGLDNSARMNIPSTVGDNWTWRMKEGMLSDELGKRLRRLNRRYKRNRKGCFIWIQNK